MQHYGYMYTEQVMARIAADLDLFTILAQSEGSIEHRGHSQQKQQ